MAIISKSRRILSLIDKINLCGFYFNGAYYHLSKRFTGIRYANIAGSTTGYLEGGDEHATKRTFKVLSYLTVLSLCFQIVPNIWHLYRNRNTLASPTYQTEIHPTMTTNLGDNDTLKRRRCPLCLDTRKDTSCTPCGHLFCWYCIMKCVSVHPECPVCRHPVIPSRIVHLQNYF